MIPLLFDQIKLALNRKKTVFTLQHSKLTKTFLVHI